MHCLAPNCWTCTWAAPSSALAAAVRPFSPDSNDYKWFPGALKRKRIKKIILFHEMLFWEFELGLLSCCHDCSHIWEPFFWNRPLKLCVGRIFFFSHTILSFRVYIIFYQKIHFFISFSECGKTMVGRRTCEKTFLWKMTRRRAVFPLEGKLIKKLIPRDFKQLRRRLVYK